MSAKKTGKVQSKRSKKSPQKRSSNKTLYFGVILIVLILILFICSHLLQFIFKDTDEFWGIERFWMGIEVSSLITDIVLYLAVGLMFVILILWIRYYISKEGVRR